MPEGPETLRRTTSLRLLQAGSTIFRCTRFCVVFGLIFSKCKNCFSNVEHLVVARGRTKGRRGNVVLRTRYALGSAFWYMIVANDARISHLNVVLVSGICQQARRSAMSCQEQQQVRNVCSKSLWRPGRMQQRDYKSILETGQEMSGLEEFNGNDKRKATAMRS